MKADNEQESAQNGLLSFIDVSRSGIQILKRSKAFKAIELIDFRFPMSTDDGVWSQRILEVIASDDLLAFTQGSETVFTVSDSKALIVPSSLFSEKEKTRNFEFLFGKSNGLAIQDQHFSNSDIVGIFGIPKVVSASIAKPIRSSYLTWLENLPNDSTKAKANLLVDEKQFVLTIFNDGKLIFSNWFGHEKADDVLYYLMASLETLKILHSELELVLAGAVDKGDAVHTAASKFISKISFAKRPKNLTYSYSFKEIPEHRYPFIFAAACA